LESEVNSIKRKLKDQAEERERLEEGLEELEQYTRKNSLETLLGGATHVGSLNFKTLHFTY